MWSSSPSSASSATLRRHHEEIRLVARWDSQAVSTRMPRDRPRMVYRARCSSRSSTMSLPRGETRVGTGRVSLHGSKLEIYLQNSSIGHRVSRAACRDELDGATVREVHRLDDNVALRGVRLEPELITSIYNTRWRTASRSRSPSPEIVTDAIIASEDKASTATPAFRSAARPAPSSPTSSSGSSRTAARVDTAAGQELLPESGENWAAKGLRR